MSPASHDGVYAGQKQLRPSAINNPQQAIANPRDFMAEQRTPTIRPNAS
jgi:hypothetical protein